VLHTKHLPNWGELSWGEPNLRNAGGDPNLVTTQFKNLSLFAENAPQLRVRRQTSLSP